MLEIDGILALLHQHKERTSPWDKQALHVSDLSLCARQVWARRNGLFENHIDLDNFVQLELGLRYESLICAALNEAGIEYEYQHPITEPLFGYSLIGTADFVFEDAVLDAKTTVFWSGWVGRGEEKRKTIKVPEEPKMSYRVTTAAYAIALGKPQYMVHVADRASGKRATFTYETSALAPFVGKAVVERQGTKPGDDEPIEAIPPWYTFDGYGESWQCKFCHYAACEKNVNESLQRI